MVLDWCHILKKMNVSFIVPFYLCQYSFSFLNTPHAVLSPSIINVTFSIRNVYTNVPIIMGQKVLFIVFFPSW